MRVRAERDVIGYVDTGWAGVSAVGGEHLGKVLIALIVEGGKGRGVLVLSIPLQPLPALSMPLSTVGYTP